MRAKNETLLKKRKRVSNSNQQTLLHQLNNQKILGKHEKSRGGNPKSTPKQSESSKLKSTAWVSIREDRRDDTSRVEREVEAPQRREDSLCFDALGLEREDPEADDDLLGGEDDDDKEPPKRLLVEPMVVKMER